MSLESEAGRGDFEYAEGNLEAESPEKDLVLEDSVGGPLGEHAAPAVVSEVGEGDDHGRFVTPSIQVMVTFTGKKYPRLDCPTLARTKVRLVSPWCEKWGFIEENSQVWLGVQQ